jgi:hypothetical protein
MSTRVAIATDHGGFSLKQESAGRRLRGGGKVAAVEKQATH